MVSGLNYRRIRVVYSILKSRQKGYVTQQWHMKGGGGNKREFYSGILQCNFTAQLFVLVTPSKGKINHPNFYCGEMEIT